MFTETFTHAIFLKNPLASLTFFSLIMCFISLWVKKTPWLWGSFLVISLILALQTSVIKPIGLVPLAILFLCFFGLKYNITGLSRLVIAITALVIGGGLYFHFFLGFSNWLIGPNQQISTNASIYQFWMNFDKPFAGLFPLIWTIPLIQSKKELKSLSKTTAIYTALAIGIMITLALYSGTVQWDPKLPAMAFVWPVVNLFFVVIPEEAFLRGFLQQELFHFFGRGYFANVGAVLVSSFIFCLFHLVWVANISFLLLVFAAGILYGTIFQLTKAIESSIFCHFTFNLLHFFFFTYPVVSS